ncbi:MAG: carotenoid 1,2-hydratase [Thermogemmatispora sp.]|uniref:lipocalin-like domain-containing protein n=1 Tax=Thermogemmatispora sp. TaxID=1968838 RepID=UPI002615A78B|nr:lipocalin-like domain-containing protein [Thermogemmatispora sp.]MBX5455865.1 carotenoid 1,2-hydratase [Thermogemmatispora sp.]
MISTLHKRDCRLGQLLYLLLALLAGLSGLSACAFPGIPATSAQLPLVPATAQATPLPPIRLPQDEAPHKDLTEWWYYTGHLQARANDGRLLRYGFELVFFQVLRSDLPPVYAAHFAISDITRGQFHFAQQRVLQLEPSSTGAGSQGGFQLQVGPWRMQGRNGKDQLAAVMPDYALQLQLQALKPAILHNGNGLITYGLAGFSYYYSRTRLAVSGLLVDHGQTLTVTGLAWMDHQWGNFLTLAGGGWDWFSLQLNDNSELMLYLIRDASKQIISTYVSFIDPSGQDHLLPASALRVQTLATWLSPVTHARYPSGWLITISNGRFSAQLTLQPELKDQELVTYQSTGNAYWEGAVSIQGQSAGHAVDGEGYVELTGYAAA